MLGFVLLTNNEDVVVRITLFSSLDREYFVIRKPIKNNTEPVTTNVTPKTFIVCRLHLNDVEDNDEEEDDEDEDGNTSSSLLFSLFVVTDVLQPLK